MALTSWHGWAWSSRGGPLAPAAGTTHLRRSLQERRTASETVRTCSMATPTWHHLSKTGHHPGLSLTIVLIGALTPLSPQKEPPPHYPEETMRLESASRLTCDAHIPHGLDQHRPPNPDVTLAHHSC